MHVYLQFIYLSSIMSHFKQKSRRDVSKQLNRLFIRIQLRNLSSSYDRLPSSGPYFVIGIPAFKFLKLYQFCT
jgi:hypothetical protein